MQDAGDSPPDRQRSEGRKRRNFSAPRRIRPKPGTASDRRTPRSRCVWQALYPLSDCFSSGCFSECLSECLRNGCGTSRAAKAAWARQGGGCEMRQGTARCGSRRRDRYGEFVRGSTRGIGAANRHKQPTRRRLQKGLRRWSARESARRFARSIGAENCAGICVRKLRQKIGTEVCRGGLSQWNYVAGLKIGTARNRYKKRPRKNRGHTVELNFRAGVSAATHIGRTKRSSFFHRLQGPEFRLSRRRIRGTVCTANSRLFFRPRVYSGLPAPAPCFGSKRLPRFRLRVPTS